MSEYQYEPLDQERSTFRQVIIRHGTGDEVDCDLIQSSFECDDLIPYEALSYTWNSSDYKVKIKVRDRYLLVTPNLFSAIHNLRLATKDRILWIDSICINQNDAIEKSHQVQQMGRIYQRADQVIVWLGTPTDDTSLLMTSLGRLQELNNGWSSSRPSGDWHSPWQGLQMGMELQYQALEARQRRGLDFLLSHKWFERVWIVQEVANARRVVVQCGNQSVAGKIFALAPQLIGYESSDHCRTILELMRGPSSRPSWWTRNRSLHSVLKYFHEAEATIKRDKIFALLDISTGPTAGKSALVNYDAAEADVVCQAIAYMFSCPLSCASEIGIRGLDALFRRLHSRPNLGGMVLETLLLSGDLQSFTSHLQKNAKDIEITSSTVSSIVRHRKHGKEALKLLLHHIGDKLHFSEDVVREIVAHETAALEMLKLIVEIPTRAPNTIAKKKSLAPEDPNRMQLQLPKFLRIDELIVKAAVNHKDYAHGLVSTLVKHFQHNGEAFGIIAQTLFLEERPSSYLNEAYLRPEDLVDLKKQLRSQWLIILIRSGQWHRVPAILDNEPECGTTSSTQSQTTNPEKTPDIRDQQPGDLPNKGLQLMLDSGLNVNAVNSTGMTALGHAVKQNLVHIVNALLDNGADVNLSLLNRQTALLIAAELGHLPIVDSLLRRGADVGVVDRFNETALNYAIQMEHLHVARRILDSVVDNDVYADMPDSRGRTALMHGAQLGYLQAVSRAIEKHAYVNREVELKGTTALIDAASGGHTEIVQALLDAGAIIDHSDAKGRTALIMASVHGNRETIMLLLNRGARVDIISKTLETALEWTIRNDLGDMIHLFLAAGARIEPDDRSGWSPLSFSVENDRREMTRILLSQGTDPNVADSEGRTALIWAAVNGDDAMLSLLLQHGADTEATDSRGWTALFSAASHGHEHIVARLVASGAASIDHATTHGTTPLMGAAMGGHAGIVNRLLLAGADYEAKDEYGATAYDRCASNLDGSTVLCLRLISRSPGNILWAPSRDRIEEGSDPRKRGHGDVTTGPQQKRSKR